MMLLLASNSRLLCDLYTCAPDYFFHLLMRYTYRANSMAYIVIMFSYCIGNANVLLKVAILNESRSWRVACQTIGGLPTFPPFAASTCELLL